MNMRMMDYDSHKNHYKKYAKIPSILIKGNTLNKQKPYISIVIPTYKRCHLLKYAIESALNQRNSSCSYEIIIVDNEPPNGGVSETEQLVQQYDSEILYYYKNNQNLGMAGNWNRCIELARGTWVAFLHDDDLLIPNYLEKITKIVKRLQKREKKIAYIKTEVIEFTGDKGIPIQREDWKLRLKRTFRGKVIKFKPNDMILLEIGILGAPTCGTLLNRKLLLKSGGYNEAHYPSCDAQLPVYLMRYGGVFRTIEPLGYYRWEQNLSFKEETMIGWVEEFLLYRRFLKKNSKIAKALYCCFRKEQNAFYLDGIFSLTQNSEMSIDRDKLYKLCEYNSNPFKYQIFKELKLLVWRTKLMSAMLFG